MVMVEILHIKSKGTIKNLGYCCMFHPVYKFNSPILYLLREDKRLRSLECHFLKTRINKMAVLKVKA